MWRQFLSEIKGLGYGSESLLAAMFMLTLSSKKAS
jgi:hypothetical protein